MVNYNNGKVYKIEPICEHEEGEIYIGSTTKDYLSKRMVAHRKDYTKYKKGMPVFTTSFVLFDKYGIENCRIILLETVNCNSKDELFARESHYIRTLKCVNIIIPDRTKKEWNKMDYQNNKEKFCKKAKDYAIQNKEKLALKYRETFICECGKETTICNKNRHNRSKRHISFIESTIDVSF
jgi:hypothetical protein